MDAMTELLALISGVFGVLDVVLGIFAYRYYRRWSGLTRPVIVKRGNRNSIMLLGLGGVGKTTFIRSLFDNLHANPSATTERYELYQTNFSIKDPQNPKKGKQYSLFVGDYRGQNLGQLVREFITQQKKSFEPMAYGYINSLILVVDLFPPPDQIDGAPLKPQRALDIERTKLHSDQWNETALDAVFGLLTRGSLKYVCLFVNKSDLLIGSEEQMTQDEITQHFSGLQARLRERTEAVGSQFQLIIGSASLGTGIPEMKDVLFSTSVPGDSDGKMA